MVTPSIQKPKAIQDIFSLLNDLKKIFYGQPHANYFITKLLKIYHQTPDHQLVEQITKRYENYLSALDYQSIKSVHLRLETILVSYLKGLNFKDHQIAVVNLDSILSSTLDGLTYESSLLYFWEMTNEIKAQIKEKHRLLRDIKRSVTISGPQNSELGINEAECEYNLVRLSKWIQSSQKSKYLGNWVHNHVSLNQLKLEWEKVMKLWVINAREDSCFHTARISFIRSLLQNFPECRAQIERTGLLDLMLEWSETELNKCLKLNTQNLQNLLSALRYLFWINSLSNDTLEENHSLHHHAEACLHKLIKAKEFWIKISQQSNLERDLDTRHLSSLRSMISQIKSICSNSAQIESRKTYYWNLGDHYTANRSSYQFTFRHDLVQLQEALINIEQDILLKKNDEMLAANLALAVHQN